MGSVILKRTLTILLFVMFGLPLSWATVGQQPYTVTYACTGSLGPYVFTYPISDPTSMRVTIDGVIIGTGSYTIVPINNNYDNGGNVTLLSACTAGHTLVLNRFTDKTQSTVYVPNIPVKTTERDLDKSTEIDQEIWGRTVHSIQIQSQGTNIGIPSSGGDITYNFANCTVNGSQTGQPPSTENNFTITCSNGGGGGDSGTLGQPMFGTGPAIQSVPTELNADLFPGDNICAQTNAAIASLPSSGGTVRLACKDYTARCSAPISWSTGPSITLKGCGNGQIQGIDKGATNIHFAAGVPGITIIGAGLTDPTDPTNPTIEGMTLSSDSSSLGTDDGIHIKFAGSPVIRDVSVKGFGRKGIYLDEGNDKWLMDRVDAANNFGDGFYTPSGCTDINVGHGNELSSTLNGGWGFNLNCGVTNLWTSTHASGNTSGCWNLNTSYNKFDLPYCEAGDSFVINSLMAYNDLFLPFFGEPNVVDNGIPYTNRIFWTSSTGAPGLYPAQNFWSISNNPSIATRQFFQMKVLEPGDPAGPGLTLVDTVNPTPPNQAITILNYNKANGWTFPVGPVTIAGPGQISLNVNASPSLTAGVFNLYGPASSPGAPLGIQFPSTIGTIGQALVLSSVSGGLMTLGYGSGGGGGTIPNTLLPLAGDNAGNARAANSGDMIGLFGGCSGSKYLGADGACHLATGITNSAGVNVVTKSDGTNVVASNLSDNGTAVTSAAPINAPSVNLGTSPPTACTPSSGCWAAGESSSAGTPTAGVDYIRADSSHKFVQSLNGGGEVPFGTGTVTSVAVGNLSPLFTSGVATATTTPTVTYTLSTAAAHTAFMNNTGSTGVPAFARPACADLSDSGAFCSSTAAASLSSGALVNGMSATTQSLADNSTKLATTAYVDASVATGSGTGYNGGLGTTYQDATEVAAPANPSAGRQRSWPDSTSHTLKCKTSSGADCNPGSGGAPAFSAITSGTNTTATMLVGTGASLAPTAAGTITPSVVTLTTSGNGGVTGNLPVNNLNSGTSANSTTFWRGDGTWAAPSATAKCDPTDATQYCFVEDFPGGSNTSLAIGTNGWTLNTIGSAGTASVISSTWPHLGVEALNTNAAATQGQGETMNMGNNQPGYGDLTANTNWSFDGIFQLQETTTSVFRIGLGTPVTALRPTSFIGLRYDVNNPLSAQATTSIICTTTTCTVIEAGGTLTLPGQSVTISGATCPTRTVNGTQVMSKLVSPTQWQFLQNGAAETCGTPGTASTIAESTFKVYTQNLNSANVSITDTGVSADTGWHNIQIASTVAGTYVFTLDGGSPITITPSSQPNIASFMEVALGVDSTVAAAKSVYLDRLTMYMSGLTR